MLKISEMQMKSISQASINESINNIDTWMKGVTPDWEERNPTQRRAAIIDIVAQGQAIGLITEEDLALFVWLGVRVGDRFTDFLADEAVHKITGWTTPNRGAVLRELFRLSGWDISQIAEKL